MHLRRRLGQEASRELPLRARSYWCNPTINEAKIQQNLGRGWHEASDQGGVNASCEITHFSNCAQLSLILYT